MVTDITKLFVDLTSIYLRNPQDIKQDSTKVPVYLIGTGWLNNKNTMLNLHNNPFYIRYTATGLRSSGGAVKIGVRLNQSDNYKYYYMSPVDVTANDIIFEINLNELITRDMAKGQAGTIYIKFVTYTKSTYGNIVESEGNSYTITGVYSQGFSRTTILDDLMLFYTYFGRIKQFVTPTTAYNKPVVSINAQYYLTGLQYVSQFDDVLLEVPLLANKDAAVCYISFPGELDPDDEETGSAYENTFSHKFNLVRESDKYRIHLNEFIKEADPDLKVISVSQTARFCIKYVGATETHQSGNLPITLTYYLSDEDVNRQDIIQAFQYIHEYI